MSHVGVRDRLDVNVSDKSFVGANGEPLAVLRDLAFRLNAGEVGALVGPSGCGKTTLLRMIAQLDDDFAGAITRPSQGRLGMVFQEPRLLPWRGVIDNLRIAAPHASEAQLDALLAAFHLSLHRDHFPGELSGGLARRVALARAFAVEPDLLLLDEPFVSLDAALATRLREELVAMVERNGVTTLLVTHDLDEAIILADRLILLSPRPARVIADIAITEKRGVRSAERIADIRREASLQFAGAAR
jgi:ABC-type nitrate/sulfonate/bicarbonate transport system ATPase subunit